MGVSREEHSFAAAALVEGLAVDAPVGFAVHDELLRFELVSPSLAAINGRPVAEHIGRRVTEILPGALAVEVEALLAGVRDSGRPRSGIELDGTTEAAPEDLRTWSASYMPIALAGRRLVGVIVLDITERRRAVTALRESERLLSGAQRMAGLGWWRFLAGPGTVAYAPELMALMGRDPALGGIFHGRDLLEVADPGERRSVFEEARAAVRERRPFARRLRARAAGGELRTLDARADLLHGEDGEPIGLHGFVQDITDLERAEERQRLVAELGQFALTGIGLDALMDEAVSATMRGMHIDGAAVLELLPNGEELAVHAAQRPKGYAGRALEPAGPGTIAHRVLTTRQPVIVDDWAVEERFGGSHAGREAGARSTAVVLIGGRAAPFGLLGTMSLQPGAFRHDETAFLQSVANLVADGVERRLAEAEIAELSAARGRLVGQALEAEEQARRAISETLHDGALQELLAAGHDLYALGGHGGDEAALAGASDRLTGVIRRLREVMGALHPTVLQHAGLPAALSAVAEQQGHAGGFTAELTVDAAALGARDGLLLSVAREALANAARHAGATHVDVSVWREDGDVMLEVADDGAGVHPGRPAAALAEGRIGLATCRERLEAVGGRLLLCERSGGGTRLLARAPLLVPAATIRPHQRSGR